MMQSPSLGPVKIKRNLKQGKPGTEKPTLCASLCLKYTHSQDQSVVLVSTAVSPEDQVSLERSRRGLLECWKCSIS